MEKSTEKMTPDLEEKLTNMYKDNPFLFMKKTIETMSEMNLEYQMEIYTLLSIIIRYITGGDDVTENEKEQHKLVAGKILENHDIEDIDGLKKAVSEVFDILKAKRLNSMPTNGTVN